LRINGDFDRERTHDVAINLVGHDIAGRRWFQPDPFNDVSGDIGPRDVPTSGNTEEK
jgi:hypothetical protein